MVIACALRGRDKVLMGSYIQKIELGSNLYSNSITTAHKDSLILIIERYGKTPIR